VQGRSESETTCKDQLINRHRSPRWRKTLARASGMLRFFRIGSGRAQPFFVGASSCPAKVLATTDARNSERRSPASRLLQGNGGHRPPLQNTVQLPAWDVAALERSDNVADRGHAFAVLNRGYTRRTAMAQESELRPMRIFRTVRAGRTATAAIQSTILMPRRR
jgi:hypothetical protein